ncbi:MAG: hypothetical protein HS111_39530 [Kofleriaceae bacterium]|nr:hypothetical protein [Kofleriaceae bacterium]MCL4227409.1 hypothetical protein [Myxococcales bacterium]
MRGDIELAGFVITQDEWRQMDRRQRAQLLRAATRRDEPWVPAAPPARPAAAAAATMAGDDAYDQYEVELAPA